MKLRRFLNVVPTGVRIAACILVLGAVLTGLLLGFFLPHDLIATLLAMGTGAGIGLFLGGLIACWLLCLGYVYGDARRRAMPPILWTLVALLVPNLLGFLLYFVLRRPLTITCAKCGQATPSNQRFCSWCGNPLPPSPPDDAPPRPDSSPLDSVTAA